MATVRGGLGAILKSANGGAIPLVDMTAGALKDSAKKVAERKKLEVTVKKSVGTLNTQRTDTVKQINTDVTDKSTSVSKFMSLCAKVDKEVTDMKIAGVEFTNSTPLLKIKKEDYSKIVGSKCLEDIIYYNVKGTNNAQTVKYKNDVRDISEYCDDILKLSKKLEDSTKKLDEIKSKEKDELKKLEKEK